MAFSIPTLGSLVARAKADVRAARSSGAAFLRKTVEDVFATVVAGLAYGNYGRLPVIANDIVPGPQNSEAALLHHASLWLTEGRLPASPARFTITGTGTDGTEVPAGTRWQRSDGAAFETTADDIFDETAPTFTVESIAVEGEPGYGAAGNCEVGDELTLVSNVPGLDTAWTVDGEPGETVGDGSDLESLESLADRIVETGANQPRGGKLTDYEKWARESSSAVGQAFAVAGLGGPGTIWVWVVTNDPEDPIPGEPLLAVVRAYILSKAPAPIGTLRVLAPVPLELDPAIELSPNTAATRAAAIVAMDEIIAMRATPGQTGNGSLFRRSWITEALSGTLDEVDHTLTDPAEDVEVGVGELVRLGTPTFSTKS